MISQSSIERSRPTIVWPARMLSRHTSIWRTREAVVKRPRRLYCSSVLDRPGPWSTMNPEPRRRNDYSTRQVQAAHRVLVDVGQVLSSFRDAIVVVGGWVPDLLLPDAEPEHVGSIDVDLALDTEKLGAGRYAELLKVLLHTGRYQKAIRTSSWQLTSTSQTAIARRERRWSLRPTPR